MVVNLATDGRRDAPQRGGRGLDARARLTTTGAEKAKKVTRETPTSTPSHSSLNPVNVPTASLRLVIHVRGSAHANGQLTRFDNRCFVAA